jgi:hypothetical protein
LFGLYFVNQLATLMLVWTVEFSCWLFLVRPCVLCFWLSWPLTLVTQSGGRKLTYIMVVARRNLHIENGHCAAKQLYENVFKNVVKVANGS